MATINSDGSLNGKHGNSVYYKRNGKNIVRAYVPHKKSNTTNQLKQQAKLRSVMECLKKFRKVINLGYQGASEPLTPMNEAISWHLLHATTEITQPLGNVPIFNILPEKLKLSRGNIEPPDIISITRTNNSITLVWKNALGEVPNRLYDNMVLTAYLPSDKVYFDVHVGERKTGTGIAILPNELSAQVHLWVFYLNVQKKVIPSKENVSDSVYLGVI